MTATERAMCTEEWDRLRELEAENQRLRERLDQRRVEWRFFWPHATDDMNGARARATRPSDEELAEWHEDMASVWIEQRTVYVGPWTRVASDELQAPESNDG